MQRLILSAAALLLLAGCSVGSSTYGTGKTQESQLVSDLASIVSFKQKKPERIDYSERPALVKPGDTASLPAPIEENSSSSAFPVSPEDARGTDGAKPSIVRNGGFTEELTAEDRKFMNWTGPNTKAYRAWTKRRVAEMKARKAAQSGGQDGKRRYFTEPPNDYRKAYSSAPTGELGMPESSKEFRKKSKGNIFSRLLGRG